ncbi:MAG: hypothetical protein LBG80_07960 [Bacteroidales bacterium]|jgi:hypothetical protein|nr:hypothetical protein [Bacteroidales bacterium]
MKKLFLILSILPVTVSDVVGVSNITETFTQNNLRRLTNHFATFAFTKKVTAKTHFVKPFVTVAPLWLKKNTTKTQRTQSFHKEGFY